MNTPILIQIFSLTLFVLCFAPPAEAYVQMVYGSLLTQVVLSGCLGLFISTQKSWFRLAANFLKQIHIFSKI